MPFPACRLSGVRRHCRGRIASPGKDLTRYETRCPPPRVSRPFPIHPDRTPVRHRSHRHSRRDSPARAQLGPRPGTRRPVRQQPPAALPRQQHVRQRAQGLLRARRLRHQQLAPRRQPAPLARRPAGHRPAFDSKKGPLAEYLADGRVKECPEFTEFRDSGDVGFEAFESGTGGYGYNAYYIGGAYYRVDFMVAPEFTTMDSRVFRPSETIMFADCAMPKEGGIIVEYGFAEPPHFVTSDHPTGNLEWGLATPSLHFSHHGRVNVVWLSLIHI